ncbi:MAG: 1-acyl-sn-glycerol-3-phosphate acyltransferase [Desulfobacterales bacterium]|nr:1-acyl-sn-glycerol-3-phosphate acyltransferase [Desulfobacterales bacterium]
MKAFFYWILYPLTRPFFLILLILDTFFLACVIIFISPFDQKGVLLHHVGKFWSRLHILLSGARVQVNGLEKIQKGQAYVLMSNHQSLFDVWVVIAYLPLQIRWIIKAEIRKMPIFGYALKRMGHIYVEKDWKRKKMDYITTKALEKIKEGTSIFIFPEGTRSKDGNLLPFKKGGALIAIRTGAPVLPITINGSRFVLPKDTMQLMPGKIQIVIGDAIDVHEYTTEDRTLLTDKVKNSIEQNLDVTYGSIP